MTNTAKIINHLNTVGHISIREAMDDYNMSGNVLTKVISDLNKGIAINTKRVFCKHPITGKRYARYFKVNHINHIADAFRS